MIILDTNVISELMRPLPDEKVTAWLGNRAKLHYGITTITIAEITRGIERLAIGKRQDDLRSRFAQFVNEAFHGRIYSFDEEAAQNYATIATNRERSGLHADPMDMLIAAIVKVHKATLATRNIKDFTECDITIMNPWNS
ncbi:MAG: type II toxin-antitoxin system VapC family toxin [Alphaproteobacteria bacterium]|nr:MAG: type II toxin-antitoxin system VapC family toxin [Alphaproteobacteria bacterium]